MKHQLRGGSSARRRAARAGVPFDAAAAVLNVTVPAPATAGYASVWPCGSRPNASTLNFIADATVPNSAIVPLSANGSICLYAAESATHLIVDLLGFVPA